MVPSTSTYRDSTVFLLFISTAADDRLSIQQKMVGLSSLTVSKMYKLLYVKLARGTIISTKFNPFYSRNTFKFANTEGPDQNRSPQQPIV